MYSIRKTFAQPFSHRLGRSGAALFFGCMLAASAAAQDVLLVPQESAKTTLADTDGVGFEEAVGFRVFPVGSEPFCPDFDQLIVRYAVYANERHTLRSRVIRTMRAAYPDGLSSFDDFKAELQAEHDQLKAENNGLSLEEFAKTMYLFGVLICEIAPDEYVRRVARTLVETGSYTQDEAITFVNSYRRDTSDYGKYRER